jgi:hypothetical protein
MDELIAWTEVHDVPVTLENHLALAFGRFCFTSGHSGADHLPAMAY